MQRTITFLRHAMPEVDPAIAPACWRLSPSGIHAASALRLHVDRTTLVSSPELKAVQTIALACGQEPDRIVIDERFREIDRIEQVHDGFRAARRAWVAGRLDERHAGWETPDALRLALPLLRVRAVLTDDDGRYVLIKRTRPGSESYWTTPGGAVQLNDASLEAALSRELSEELGATALVGSVVLEKALDGIRSEVFYAAQLLSMDPMLRDGAEFDDPSRGSYEIERVSRDDLSALDLRPAELKAVLLGT